MRAAHTMVRFFLFRPPDELLAGGTLLAASKRWVTDWIDRAG
jgi:hypothetical protein